MTTYRLSVSCNVTVDTVYVAQRMGHSENLIYLVISLVHSTSKDNSAAHTSELRLVSEAEKGHLFSIHSQINYLTCKDYK